MDYSIANFEQAVSQFYYTDAVLQAQAHQWLVSAQTSPNAWSFVWELLQKDRSTEVQFFAATTLHMKIMKSWNEVPSKDYEALRKHLLEAILSYSVGPKIVLNRLCIALSAYILQTMPVYWPNAIAELLVMFQLTDFEGLSPDRRVWILLEVLTVIPEEFESMNMIQRHKQTVRHELEKNTTRVLSLVQSVLAEAEKNAEDSHMGSNVSNNNELLCQAVRCASTWLHFGISISDCDHLASLLVRVVINSSVNSSSTEAAELGIEALDQMLTHPDASKMPSIVMNLIQRILCLKDIVKHCQDSENHELMRNLYSLFVSIVEAHSSLLLRCLMSDMRDVTLQLLQVIMSCTKCPGNYPMQETCSRLTFGIWYILQDELVNMEPVNYANLLPILGPIYQELVLVLLKKSEYPSDGTEFSSEDKETFRWYRQDVADTLMYCCNVLRDSTLDILLSQLQTTLISAKSSWQPLESCLHAFAAVSENIDEEEEDKYLPVFFTVLQSLPFDSLHIHVATTALDVVGSYATWLNYHPDTLANVVPLLLMGLNNCDTAPSATMSLKYLTRECQLKMKPYAEVILQTSQRVLSENKLKQNECVRLMYTIGRVLSVLPLDNILQYLDSLLMPCIDEIKTLLEQEPSVSVKSNLLVRMEMLGMLLSTLDIQLVEDEKANSIDENKSNQQHSSNNDCLKSQSQPVFIVLRHLMPVLDAVVNKWPTDSSIVQAVFSVFKHGVTTLLDDCAPLIPNIVEIILNSYKSRPTASAVDLSKQISLLIGSSSQHKHHIHNLIFVITVHTLHISRPDSPTGGDLAPYTDVIEYYLQLIGALIKKNPSLLLEIEHLNISDVFQFAMKALMLPELPTVRATVAFFTAVISQSRDHNALLMCVQIHGEELVEKLLRCIGGEASRSNIEPLSDIILALNKKHCDNISRWLPAQLSRPDFPSSRPSNQAKVQFAKMVLRERVNKRKLQEIVREFSLLCRGLVTTDYAALTNNTSRITPDI